MVPGPPLSVGALSWCCCCGGHPPHTRVLASPLSLTQNELSCGLLRTGGAGGGWDAVDYLGGNFAELRDQLT